jgi:recombination protein RecA
MPPRKKTVATTDDKTESRIGSTLNKLKSRYPGKVFSANEYTMPWMLKRLPTGILDLDIELGGGFPAGGMSFITGKQGVGKNWLINQVIRLHQQRHGHRTSVAIVSTEMVYDKEFAQLCGVKVAFSDQEIAQLRAQYERYDEPFPAEFEEQLRDQVGDFVTVPPSLAEESLQIAIDLIASREFDIVVIDSFGSLLTEHAEEGDLSDSTQVGGAAGLNTKFARKLNTALSTDSNGTPNLTCVLAINQVRDNMDRANKYSPKTQEAGGWALKHARWVTVEMASQGKVREGDLTIGKTNRWEITKQKAGGHEGATGTFDFLYKHAGIDRAAHSAAVAARYGIIEKKGAWYSYEGKQIGQGTTAMAQFLVENDLVDKIEEDTLRAARIHCSYG